MHDTTHEGGRHSAGPAAAQAEHRTLPGPLRVLKVVDLISVTAARIGAVMIVVIAVILAYEVTARYIFRAPTRWTSDVGTTLMMWLTFVAMAETLRTNAMIRITALVGYARPAMRKLSQAFTLLVVGGFAVLAVWLCIGEFIESVATGRRQPTMLQMPEWLAETPIIVGYACLALQAFADLVRLPFRPAPNFMSHEEAEVHSLAEEGR
jgi:TRAP-type C4-dicarboxylate transport system permease small subunit